MRHVDGYVLMKTMGPKAPPFDGKRMFWGGFKVLVEA
jgi:uncharacterized protein YbaA (DUF1428 family)